MRYLLDENNNPYPEPDLYKWAEGFDELENSGRKYVGSNTYTLRGHDILVSTVFLGIDHSFAFGLAAQPVLFETMVFAGDIFPEMDGYTERYSTYAEAQAGHTETNITVRRWVRRQLLKDKAKEIKGRQIQKALQPTGVRKIILDE